MRGRFWVAAAAISYGLIGAGMSLAGCATVEARELRRQALREVSGTVARVEVAQGRLALDLPGGLIEFRIDKETVFFLPGRVATLEDLREGQQVRAVYEPGATPALIQWLELGPPPAPVAGSGR